MHDLLESLGQRLSSEWKRRKSRKMLARAYHCRCGTAIFFRNTQCLSCKSALGFVPATQAPQGTCVFC